MIYGLYLSATGVLTNSYRQDVIANNLANSETVGFKKDLALFRQRRTAAGEHPEDQAGTDRLLEGLGGGQLASPTLIDSTQGELEPTGNALDAAIEGNGYFAVQGNGQKHLTRDGRFTVDRMGRLGMASNPNQLVLDKSGKPISIIRNEAPIFSIATDGQITQNGRPIAQLGVFTVPDGSQLHKDGGNLMTVPDGVSLKPATGISVRGEFIERANVDPATELSALMDAQRQLEANANMIRYQDSTLQRLVNDVGKVG